MIPRLIYDGWSRIAGLHYFSNGFTSYFPRYLYSGIQQLVGSFGLLREHCFQGPFAI